MSEDLVYAGRMRPGQGLGLAEEMTSLRVETGICGSAALLLGFVSGILSSCSDSDSTKKTLLCKHGAGRFVAGTLFRPDCFHFPCARQAFNSLLRCFLSAAAAVLTLLKKHFLCKHGAGRSGPEMVLALVPSGRLDASLPQSLEILAAGPPIASSQSSAASDFQFSGRADGGHSKRKRDHCADRYADDN